MSIRGFGHLYVETHDFREGADFWEALGFQLVEQWGEGGHKAGRLVRGDTCVVLAESDKPCAPTVHFAIEDAEALDAKLSKSPHVKVTTPLENTHWGTRWIRVQDPDGNTYALEA